MSHDEDEVECNERPLVRSLSMSRNMAFSVVDEVQHMIKILPAHVAVEERRSWWKATTPSATSLRKSSSLTNVSQYSHSTTEPEDVDETTSRSRPQLRRGSSGLDIQNALFEYDATNGIDEDVPLPISRNHGQDEKTIQSITGPQQPQITPIMKGTRRNDLLIGIIVSRWDNIVGPQSIYLWTEEMTSVFYPTNLPSQLNRLVKYVTDHTVDHQTVTGGYIPPTVQRTTLCIVPDLSLAYLSLSIRVPTEIDTILEFQSSAPMSANHPDNPALTMPHSISVLSNLKFLNQFLQLRPLLGSWLLEFGPQIGVLLCKDNLQSSMINSWCAELCKTITAIQTCWAQEVNDIDELPPYQQNHKSFNNNTEPEPSIKIRPGEMEELECDANCLPSSAVVSKSCLGNILTSHLTTFGSSIVVGYDTLVINQIIRFLLCFATTPEAYCSRYALATLPDTFMKGLFIQGLILGGIGEKSISHKQVACSRLPLSRIELGSKVKVKQTVISTHCQDKDIIVMQELHRLWTSSGPPVQPVEPFPNPSKDVAGFIAQFLNELHLLPPDRRYGRLLLFKRVLHAKALSLITFLHSIQHKPPKERTKLKQLLPQILGFDNSEYLIVQVTAEKIRPGVMSLLVP